MAQGKKWVLHVTCTRSNVQNFALDVVISLYEPYQSVPNVFISNKMYSNARNHCWSTTLASHLSNRPSSFFFFFSSFFSQASTIMAEAIQARRSNIFSGVLMNPRRACAARVTVLSFSVCLSVSLLPH